MTGPRPRRRASPRRSTRGRRPWRFALALLLGAVGLLPAGVEGQGAGATPPPARGMTLVLPPLDDGLQTGLDALVAEEPYRSLVRQGRLSIALVDLSDPGRMRYAAIDEDRMRYAASLPKIAIMLGVFDQIERGNLEYTPELRDRLERMIRRSENRVSSELIELVGFESIEAALRDPRHQLYEARRGGLWVGKGYGGLGVWKRDPKANLSHGATARQVARFLVMLQQRRLVSEWASTEMSRSWASPRSTTSSCWGSSRRARAPGCIANRAPGASGTPTRRSSSEMGGDTWPWACSRRDSGASWPGSSSGSTD